MKGRKKVEAGTMNIQVQAVEVENPMWSRAHHGAKGNARFITADINIRESSITTLFARKLILPHQKEAADRFRSYYEAMGGAGASAIDYGREHVDGGNIPEPIKVRHLEAGAKLAQAHKTLGNYGYRMTGLICGEGHGIRELTRNRRESDTLMDNLRMWLDELAGAWGLSTRPGVVGRNWRAKR